MSKSRQDEYYARPENAPPDGVTFEEWKKVSDDTMQKHFYDVWDAWQDLLDDILVEFEHVKNKIRRL